MNRIATFSITSHTYYDQYNQNYKNILMVNIDPPGPLRSHVRPLRLPRLSPFSRNQQNNYIGCGLAIVSLRSFFESNSFIPINNIGKYGFDLMTPDEIPYLITFLESNGYQIETQITNMLNQSEVKLTNRKLVFNVTYYGENKPNIVYMR
jgi:hypothetical protein